LAIESGLREQKLMTFQAVIFDLFGTLVDDFVSSTGQMNADLLAALDAPREPFMQQWRQTSEMRTIGEFQTVEASIEHVCATIGVQVSTEQMTSAVEIRLKYIRRALEPRADALPALRQLKNGGYKIGLLSNCSIEIPILWPETPFVDVMDTAVFSSRDRLRKPDVRIYRLASDRLGVEPESCLYVADGENHELSAAAKIGMRSVLLQNPNRDNSSETLREAREWQGEAICDLPGILTMLNERS
jgi:putative hydrolase of the HAD superfamily